MLRPVLLSAAVLGVAGPAFAQRSRPYTEGPVSFVSYIRTKPGKFDEYMKYVQGPQKTLLEELKKEGVILSYSFYSSQPRNRDDWDFISVVVVRNMGALDGFQDRADPILERLMGSQEKRNQQAIDRETLREVLGTRLLRELQLK